MRNMKLKSIESERNVKGNVLFFARIKTRQNANQREKKTRRNNIYMSVQQPKHINGDGNKMANYLHVPILIRIQHAR